MKKILHIIFLMFCAYSNAQVKIKGTVYNEYLEPFYNVIITNQEGRSFKTDQEGEVIVDLTPIFPQFIKVNHDGFETEKILINTKNEEFNIVLKQGLSIDNIVVSASRTPERIIESPVAIEMLTAEKINHSSTSIYDALANLSGVHYRPISYGFSTLNTRGFSTINNPRFLQLLDGVDTSLPSSNYSEGSLGGAFELDIKKVEILSGASSALYGANAYNGLLLMSSKNPFDYEGISVAMKSGFTKQTTGNNPFYDVSARLAYKFNDKFAAKINFGYYTADEWTANDYRSRDTDTKELYIDDVSLNDGLNSYGDEIYVASIYRNGSREWLYRTGYTENELRQNTKVKNIRFAAELLYRPIKNNSLELGLSTNRTLSDNSIFSTNSRAVRSNYYIERDKLEIKNKSFYIKSYISRVVSDKLHELEPLGALMNGNNSDWYKKFAIPYNLNENVLDARLYADKFRPIPGSLEFNSLLNNITEKLTTNNGVRLYDKSNYFHTDTNYDFKELIDWASIQIGGSFRKYNPDTKGTILNDELEKVIIQEFGVYSQIQKKILNEKIKITSSFRYDKSTNFKANLSPKLAINYIFGEDKTNVIRASYQTAFRNPTLNEQYLFKKSSGLKMSVGATEDNLRRISFGGNNVDMKEPYRIEGADLLNNALDLVNYYDGDNNKNGILKVNLKPETNKTFELGYRSLVNINSLTNLNINISSFYSKHKNFIYSSQVIIPGGGNIYPNGFNKLSNTEKNKINQFIKNEIIRISDNLYDGDYSNNYNGNIELKKNIDEKKIPEFQKRFIRNDILIADEEAMKQLLAEGYKESLILTNAEPVITSYGINFKFELNFLRHYNLGLNYDYIDYNYLKGKSNFEPEFNTPNHTAKFQFVTSNIIKNLGFNISGRWTSAYKWIGIAVKGNVAATTVFDGQLNYKIPKIRSLIKIGATNLLNNEYFIAPGMGKIGSTYYVSWIIND